MPPKPLSESKRKLKQTRGYDCAADDCCNKIKFDGKFLECQRCKGLFHLACSGITENVFDALEADSLVEAFIWCCSACHVQARKAIDTVDLLNQKIEGVDKKTEDLKKLIENRLDVIESKINKKECEVTTLVDDKIKGIQQNFTSLKRVSLLEKKAQSIEEENDKKKRINNLIFYNIPESKSENINERFTHDCSMVKQMFKTKNLTLNVNDITNVFRLGKLQIANRPRPVLVRFNDESTKKNILKYCRDLKIKIDNESFSVHYAFDLTIKERVERKKLVEELKRRQQTSENQLGIRNGKIVTLLGSNKPVLEFRKLIENVFTL